MDKIRVIRKFSIFLLFIIVAGFMSGSLMQSYVYGANPQMIIKMATLAPNGSPWHEILKEMAQEWSELSNVSITLRIYPGGVAGDEGDMVRKMRIGQLQAAALTVGGLSKITDDVNALTIPMQVTTWKKLEVVENALAPEIEKSMDQQGFVVLNWGDAGWVRFFVPDSTPDIETVKKAKLFVWAGDDRTVNMWKSAGFNAVPLAATDILPALQSGMINAYNTSAIVALASQWFAFTPYMIDMPWAPLVGAMVIDKRTWNKIPTELKTKLKESAVKTGEKLHEEIKRLENQAIEEMKKRGLTVIKPDRQQLQQWQNAMEAAYPQLRGTVIPAALFDRAMSALKEETKLGRP
jgi:TRAP-type C4-dicarboxylate transport system substrate-binding protein